MPSCPSGDFEVYVRVDGKRLDEYEVQHIVGSEGDEKGENITSCYIASEVGKEFIIEIQDLRPNWEEEPEVLGTLRIHDRASRSGVKVANSFIDSDTTIEHVYLDEGRVAPLVFSEIELTGMFSCSYVESQTIIRIDHIHSEDDEDNAQDAASEKSIGKIRLWIVRVKILGSNAPKKGVKDFAINNRKIRSRGPIIESSKKAGGHWTKLGKPVKLKNPDPFWEIEHLKTYPSVVFTFFYHHRDWLLANKIIPSPKAESPKTEPKAVVNFGDIPWRTIFGGPLEPEPQTDVPISYHGPALLQIPASTTSSFLSVKKRQRVPEVIDLTVDVPINLNTARTHKSTVKRIKTEQPEVIDLTGGDDEDAGLYLMQNESRNPTALKENLNVRKLQTDVETLWEQMNQKMSEFEQAEEAEVRALVEVIEVVDTDEEVDVLNSNI
ncbi:hypothetical protein SISSUDRAFT_1057796 [Sistotremastrum suecicum HHB10207 ss-3]|uniref:DUF7918 domain-containing protein n=1 Tax=Sistotremastrum suecicum HHB10207 ss-3 TaxID=1314776 RepID=A0A166I538_9AGAM|nr:hypothetical protein SISSUDRAFT_1057796 [Sistotremastrum suecicum HHB10207 ss-3]